MNVLDASAVPLCELQVSDSSGKAETPSIEACSIVRYSCAYAHSNLISSRISKLDGDNGREKEITVIYPRNGDQTIKHTVESRVKNTRS
jgi:hypothetical protein